MPEVLILIFLVLETVITPMTTLMAREVEEGNQQNVKLILHIS